MKATILTLSTPLMWRTAFALLVALSTVLIYHAYRLMITSRRVKQEINKHC